MAFKMKGSAFKLGNVATKSALKQRDEEGKAKMDEKSKRPDTGAPENPWAEKGYKGPPMKSPLEQEEVATTEPVEETEEVVEEKVNPYGDHMKSVEANTWKQINTGDISENWRGLQEQLQQAEKLGWDTKGLKKTMREVQKAMQRKGLPLF